VKAAVDKGASVNSQNSNGSTALHVAAADGNVDMFQFLITEIAQAHKELDFNIQDYNGHTPLQVAGVSATSQGAKIEHLRIVELLLQKEAGLYRLLSDALSFHVWLMMIIFVCSGCQRCFVPRSMHCVALSVPPQPCQP
jgi:hypothetical protein